MLNLVKQISCLMLAGGLLSPAALTHPRSFNASATYYSDYFNGRRMANGQRFSQGQLVAAHPSLKFGTRLRVTYKGRSVYVTVKDRCNCSLDLSKAAFSQLSPLRRGRVPVKVTVVR